ncbi:M13 family peptidase [Muribaculaceae bacterium Isolate-039 (Harlan)]|jgi:putative endopeptidase|uniref:M13 family metallopeptidase n=1 Tax=Duncaniella muris TaxID=2094150 RepID=UPI000F464C47|nr:M13 family metallopeptidase [Duncaniella muris]ROS90647.1 M13 family peptidase [Muribaculaceae bacterium Isolate-039 (Harlan)]ROS96337.1 M13 family peptidase [Muribaculaceae bacterium Isolate-083 (Janvier)]ROS96667.1 M13 family peptidase [Muribaculaceae bacterium Isolate-077 (Janvier)]ROT00567.1 M13 family peptidase [Muribaculaceae bacterium Isolate-084 (Janvier)]
MKLLPLTAVAMTMTFATVSCSQRASEHLASLNVAYLDTTVAPGADFYTYVNKGWMEAHPLTAEHARYGQFDILNDSSENRVKELIANLGTTNPEPGTVAHKVWTIYSQAMDTARRNREGATPILADLKKIEETPHEGMEDLFLWMHGNYASPFFGAGPMEDLANSQVYAMYLSNGGMGLGDRDYYLLDDERNTAVRNAYRKLIATQMQNAGYAAADAARITNNVMKIETALAQKTLTREESRDIPRMYNPRTFAQVKEVYPNVNWDRFFIETMGIKSPDTLIVTEPEYLAQADKLMGSLSDREIKDYYLWKYVSQAASKLSDNFTQASFEFSKVMSGVQELRPLWKRAIDATEGALGEAVGELYVAKYFPQSSKDYMLGLVENLRVALGKHIDNLDWMSDTTKARAHEKLAAFTVKIGYPDKWKDYSTMKIDPELSYYENMHNVGMWHQAETYAKWGKPVDRTEWGMTPQTVNAYYNPLANEIVFPAAILQAPFFDPNASDAENYGGIGVVIGHEMTHGFDDQGRNFDANGNMTDWWTPEDAARFTDKTKALIAQFDEVEVLPGVHANGRYTLGENIADQGGLRIAMTAFLDAQEKKGVDIKSPEAKIDGFDPLQVFYMNYANLWANNIRDEEIRSLTTGDVHSLGCNRVNVTLRNIAPFFEAFSITEGQPMFRPEAERVIIW